MVSESNAHRHLSLESKQRAVSEISESQQKIQSAMRPARIRYASVLILSKDLGHKECCYAAWQRGSVAAWQRGAQCVLLRSMRSGARLRMPRDLGRGYGCHEIGGAATNRRRTPTNKSGVEARAPCAVIEKVSQESLNPLQPWREREYHNRAGRHVNSGSMPFLPLEPSCQRCVDRHTRVSAGTHCLWSLPAHQQLQIRPVMC